MKYHIGLLVFAWIPPAPLQGAESLKDHIAKLVSPVTTERRAGEAWLAERGTEVISSLIEQVERGDSKNQTDAMQSLLLLVSPWQRGVERGRRHHGQIELFRPERPTGRPVDHSQAAKIRKVLLEVMAKSLKDIPRETPADGDYVTYSRHSQVITASLAMLAEVADDRTAQSVRESLEKETNPTLGLQLMRCLETVYGLPAYFEMHGLCGVGLTPEALREHEKREAEAFSQQRKVLLQWLDDHAQQPATERIDAAITVWVERSKATPMYYVSRGNNTPILVLARLGDAAVPGLRKQEAHETTLQGRGFLETVIATITGKVDDNLVRELIDARQLTDPNLHVLACAIIALANSQAYQKDLTAMLGDARYSSLDVAHTLAIVHRRNALTVLRMQPVSNYIAQCAVKELESWDE